MKDNNDKVILDHIIMDLGHILRKNQLKGRVEALHHLGSWSYLDCHNQQRSVMLGKDGSVVVCGFNDMYE